MPPSIPAHGDSRIGSTLNQTYRIERLLGVGGMGVVYEAQHVHLRRPVAVKVLHPQISEMHVPLERFRREAQITSQLGHPGLVSVIDFNFTEDGAPYMVMELLKGETLAQRLAQGPLELPDACAMFSQLCDALHVVHEAGVVHRDLKPDNIFLLATDERPSSFAGSAAFDPNRDTIGIFDPLEDAERSPQTTPGPALVKILDFGVSKIHDAEIDQRNQGDLTGHEVLGTPSYLAPEQATGSAHEVDRRADIFALGTILYECLTGQKAFDGPHAVAILRIMMTQTVPRVRDRLPSLPAGIDEVIARACAMEPTARFATARQMCEALFASVGLPRPAPLPLGGTGSTRSPRPLSPPAYMEADPIPAKPPTRIVDDPPVPSRLSPRHVPAAPVPAADSEWGDGDTLFDAEVENLRIQAQPAYSMGPSVTAPGSLPPHRPGDDFTMAEESVPSLRPKPRLPSGPSDRATAIFDTLTTPPAGVTRPSHWALSADATRDVRDMRAPPSASGQKSWVVTLTTALVAVLVGIVVGMVVLKTMSRDDHPSLALERTQQVEQLLGEGERLAEQGKCADAIQRGSAVLLLDPASPRARRLIERCKR